MTASTLQLPIELSELRSILKRYGVVSASVFGSYARGEARPDSDLDLLIKCARRAQACLMSSICKPNWKIPRTVKWT